MCAVWFSSEKGAALRPPCAVGRIAAASVKAFALLTTACSLRVGVLGLAEVGPLP